MCLNIFDRWQYIHAHVHLRQSFFTPGHTKGWEMTFPFALVPRWPITWSVEHLPPEGCGNIGRGLAADVSQGITKSEPGTGFFSNRSAVCPCKRAASFASFTSSSTKASGETDAQTASTRDRASATTLSCPDICRMSVVNCDMRSRYLNCRGLQLSRFWLMS